MHFGQAIYLFLVAVLAGTLNSVAGGGSFISFPVLIFTGMSPIAANATNTAAVWPGTVASTFAYRREFNKEGRALLVPLLITGIIGGVLGAVILLHTPQTTFLRLVPWLLLFATALFAGSGQITKWVRSRNASGVKSTRLFMAFGYFLELLMAMYIGYFGAGVGILVLALLAFFGMENINAMNGIKVLLVSVVNGVSVLTFVWAGMIVWPVALLMAVGSILGGYGGAYFAQKMSPQSIRWVVIVVGLSMTLYFFIRPHH